MLRPSIALCLTVLSLSPAYAEEAWQGTSYAELAALPLAITESRSALEVSAAVVKPGPDVKELPPNLKIEILVNGQHVPISFDKSGQLQMPWRRDWADADAELRVNCKSRCVSYGFAMKFHSDSVNDQDGKTFFYDELDRSAVAFNSFGGNLSRIPSVAEKVEPGKVTGFALKGYAFVFDGDATMDIVADGKALHQVPSNDKHLILVPALNDELKGHQLKFSSKPKIVIPMIMPLKAARG